MDPQTSLAQGMLADAVDIFECCILTWDFLPVVLPAYLLAGAIAAFVPVTKVLRYLGYQAKRWVAYGTAVCSGIVISMCSCNIVPLALSILRNGSGIGPAFALLFAGPALNLVTLVWTYQVFGGTFGTWRLFGTAFVALVIGGVMSLLFQREERKRQAEFAESGGPAALELELPELEKQHPQRSWALMAGLMVILILGAKGLPWALRIPVLLACTGTLVWMLNAWFEPGEVKLWLRETWGFFKMTMPVLIPAILLIAIAARHVPLEWFTQRADGTTPFFYLGDNSLRSTTLASIFASLMYFPILTEVPFVKAFLKQGMGVAPSLALLMGGPGVSTPGALLLARALGWKKMLAYMALQITGTVGVAYAFGRIHGDYQCPCLTGAEQHVNLEWVTAASGIFAVFLLATVFLMWRRSRNSTMGRAEVPEKR